LHIVANPPYGERLEGDMNLFYSEIGDTLKQKYSDTQAWMISANMEALKHVGLRPSRKIKLFIFNYKNNYRHVSSTVIYSFNSLFSIVGKCFLAKISS
jgi:23S rRNA G2445 N2-methylase RlmL